MYRSVITPKEGTLQVIDEDKTHYILCCSLCSKDEELWPKGSIKTRKGDYNNKGIISCGCGNTNWKEFQAKIRIRRKLSSTPHILFLGFAESYKGQHTKCILKNENTGEAWEDTSIKSVMKGNFKFTGKEGFKQVCRENAKHSYDKWLDLFEKAGFKGKGYFCIDINKKGHWLFKCNSCSKDKFTENGVCTGVFSAKGTTLRKGHIPCRCTKRFNSTLAQKEYLVKEKLSTMDGVFIDWVKGKEGKNFSWVCEKGHINDKSNFSAFVNRTSGCSYCHSGKGILRPYHDSLDKQDYLYLIDFKEKDYFKVGRSFNPDQRVKDICRQINKYYEESITCSVVGLYEGKHKDIFNLEQEILYEFRAAYPDEGYGSCELLNDYVFTPVVNYLSGVKGCQRIL